jgi:hypothetical protein
MSVKVEMEDIRNLKHMLGAGEHIKQKNRGYRNYAVFYSRNAEYDRLVDFGLAEMFEHEGVFKYRSTVVGMMAAGLTKKQIEDLAVNE